MMESNRKILYMHIGSHKTGTSSIQRTLVKNKELLTQHGYVFFHRAPSGIENKYGNSSGWVEHKPSDMKTGIGAKVSKKNELFSQLGKLSANKVIISAENFSWFFLEKEVYEIKKQVFKFFDEVKIIVYLRRQDKQVISHHQQGSKKYKYPSHSYYGGDSLSIPKSRKNYDEYLDYNSRLSIWADEFGDDNIIIRVFEKDSLVGSDVVVDFFALLGIKEGFKSNKVNVSRGFEKVKVGHLVSKSITKQFLVNRIISSLSNEGKSLPSKDEAFDFYQRYRSSNIQLNKRFSINNIESIFSDDFSSYPEEASDKWSEDTANAAILKILESINKLFADINPKDLTEASKLLEKKNKKLSLKLSSLAKELTPKNKQEQLKVIKFSYKLGYIAFFVLLLGVVFYIFW